MDNKPSIDRELLIPILVGGISVFGIIMILVVARLNESRAAVPVEQTETPFKYIFLGTEPGIVTGSPEVLEPGLLTNLPSNSPTSRATSATPLAATPTFATPNNTTSPGFPSNDDNGPPINVTSQANTSVPTSTSASGPPLNPGTYDDVDSHLVYDGPGWTSQTGVPGAEKGTLHVSTVPGSSVRFTFIGVELRLVYQGATSLGEMTITIDNSQNFTLVQSSGNEWTSGILTNGTHTVLITHASGGSVNLDSVIIPEVANTATPSATPTRTATP